MSHNWYFFRIKTQFDNLGDALINRELINLLAKHGTVVLGLSNVPNQFRNWLEPLTPSIERSSRNAWYILKLFPFWFIGRSPWWILNPGAYGGEISSQRYIARRIKAFILRVFRIRGGRVLQIGVSFDNLGSRHTKAIRALANQTDVHLVRDSETLSYCSYMGIRVDGRLSDLAFSLPPALPKHQNNMVLISLRAFRDGNSPDLSKIVSAVPAKYLFLSWQVKRDELVAKQIQQYLAPESIMLPCLDSIDKTREIYGSCKLVVTNRLHVFLLTLSSGGLPILLSENGQNQKIRGVVKDANLENLILSADEIANLVDDDKRLYAMRKHCANRYLMAHNQFLESVNELMTIAG